MAAVRRPAPYLDASSGPAASEPPVLRRLLVVLAGALLLRAPGILWGWEMAGPGTGLAALHPDEQRFLDMARELESGRIQRRSYVFGWGNALRLLRYGGRLAGTEFSDADLRLAGRILSLTFGLLLVVIVYGWTRDRFGSDRVGLAAAALVGANTLCAMSSHFTTADAAYCTLLYAFVWVAERAKDDIRPDRVAIAAGLAGLGMAVKFGLVMLPTLLWLALLRRRRRLVNLTTALGVCLLVFFASQSWNFNRESVLWIWRMFTRENLGGFHHPRWWNLPVYSLELVRGAGIPVAAAVAAAAVSAGRRFAGGPRSAVMPVLPVLLHGVAIMLLAVPFPRHLLPLMPLALAGAAAVVMRLPRRAGWLALCVVWSLLLSVPDTLAFVDDARRGALAWLRRNVAAGTPVYTDPGFRVAVTGYVRPRRWYRAQVFVVHEAWAYRFGRSELHPFGIPGSGELYHATPVDALFFRRLERAARQGRLTEVSLAQPPSFLPEARLYARLWGSYNKFAGWCRVLVRSDSASSRPGG